MNFLQKIGLMTSAAANDLADQGIERLSIPVLKEQLRGLESAVESLRNQLTIIQADQIGYNREIKSIQDKIAHTEDIVTRLLAENDQTRARLRATEIAGLQASLATKQKQLTDSKLAEQKLAETIDKLELKRQEARNELTNLMNQSDQTKTLNQAAGHVGQIDHLLTGDDVSADLLRRGIQHKNDVATVRFNTAMAKGHEDDDLDASLKSSEVDDILNRLKPKATTPTT